MDCRRSVVAGIAALAVMGSVASAAPRTILDATADGQWLASVSDDATFAVRGARAVVVTLSASGQRARAGVQEDVAVDVSGRVSLSCPGTYRYRTMTRTARIAIPMRARTCKVDVTASGDQPLDFDTTDQHTTLRVLVVRSP